MKTLCAKNIDSCKLVPMCRNMSRGIPLGSVLSVAKSGEMSGNWRIRYLEESHDQNFHISQGLFGCGLREENYDW